MSTAVGFVGIGNDDILIENFVLAIKLVFVKLNPILLFTTYAVYVLSSVPCTISTRRGKSWKLSNYYGNVIYIHWPIDTETVHTASIMKNVD